MEGMHSMYLILLLFVNLAAGQSDFGTLIELKKGFQKDPSGVLNSWDSKSLASDGCPENWYGIICSEGQITSMTLNDLGIVGDFHFSAIAGLKRLQNLSISNNLFTGTVEEVSSIESLAYLDLSRNAFHGVLPSDLTHLKKLVLLNLSSNNFEGKLPSGFGNLEELKYIAFRANGFSGEIMGILSELGSVVHVDLSSNQFSGSLDLGLANSSFISSIQYLNLSSNSLVGQPFAHDGMPYFDSLEVFDASNNQLVGDIPSFNFVVSLRILRLGRNLFTGSLPVALFQESSMILSELDLSLNQLEGILFGRIFHAFSVLPFFINKMQSLLFIYSFCFIALSTFFSMDQSRRKGPAEGAMLKVEMDYLCLQNAYRLRGNEGKSY